MVANRSHWFASATIAKLKICRFNAKPAQISLSPLESFEVTECESERVMDVISRCLLSIMAFVFARVVVSGEQAIPSDHTCQVAFSVFFGFRRRLMCLPNALDKVINREVWPSAFSLHFAGRIFPPTISQPTMVTRTDHAVIV